MSGEQTHETFLSLTCKFHLEPKPTMKITSTHIFPKNAKLPNSFIWNGKSSCSLARATKRGESINHHQQTPKQTHTKITKWIEIFGENKQIHSLVLFFAVFAAVCECWIFHRTFLATETDNNSSAIRLHNCKTSPEAQSWKESSREWQQGEGWEWPRRTESTAARRIWSEFGVE